MSWIAHKIKEVQQASFQTKLRWTIGSTALAMVVVVAIWIMYTKTIIETASRPSLTGTNTGEPGVLRVLGAGIGSVIESIRYRTANTILYFQKNFVNDSSFTITPQPSTTPTPTETEPTP